MVERRAGELFLVHSRHRRGRTRGEGAPRCLPANRRRGQSVSFSHPAMSNTVRKAGTSFLGDHALHNFSKWGSGTWTRDSVGSMVQNCAPRPHSG